MSYKDWKFMKERAKILREQYSITLEEAKLKLYKGV